MIKLISAALCIVSVSGCARLDRSAIAYNPTTFETNPQRLFTWRSNYSAGVSSGGGICVQAATTARSTSTAVDVAVNAALLKALDPTLLAAGDKEAIKASTAIRESVMLTNATNGQTAYANIAYFYLCQISQNKDLSSDQIVAMWLEVTKTVAHIGTVAHSTSSTTSPELPQEGKTVSGQQAVQDKASTSTSPVSQQASNGGDK